MDLNVLRPVWENLLYPALHDQVQSLSARRGELDAQLVTIAETGGLGLSADDLFALAVEALVQAGVVEVSPPDRLYAGQRARELASPLVSLDEVWGNSERMRNWFLTTADLLTRHEWSRPIYPSSGFSRLVVNERWRQFAAVDITFHPRMTILTGSNGCGKTTLLGLLARHFNWNLPLVSARLTENLYSDFRDLAGVAWSSNSASSRTVGSVSYTSGRETPIYASSSSQPHTDVGAVQPDVVRGLFIPSHRTLPRYHPLANIPAHFPSKTDLLDRYSDDQRQTMLAGATGGMSAWLMKEALFAAVVWGPGSDHIKANAYAEDTWTGFQEVLRSVLPEEFGFEGLAVEPPDLIVQANGSRFLLESLSGGLSAIFDLCWQIFLLSESFDHFTVCIDEPENHLHPGLQRTLLPGLLAAFPRIRFVVATHSPFIITSVRDSSVYSLLPGRDGIQSSLVDGVSMSSTPDRVLMEILGLDSTLPKWAEDAVDEVPENPTEGDLRKLRSALAKLGIKDQFPAAVKALTLERNAQD